MTVCRAWKRTSTQIFTFEAIAVGVVIGIVLLSLGVATSRARDTPGGTHSPFGTPIAVAARQVLLNDKANLHVGRAQGSNLDALGHISGTLNGAVTLHFTIVSPSVVTGVFVAYPHGGFIEGRSVSRYYVAGSLSHFKGTLSITRGGGIYAHASGGGIRIQGTMDRGTRHVEVQIDGKMHT
jgi:hypothetical protein